MCNTKQDFFSDLDDSDFDSAPTRSTTSEYIKDIGDVEIPGFTEDCSKCKGRGYVNIYRRGGGYGQIPERRDCFKCKGAGKLTFKTSPEARGKARVSAQKRTVSNKAKNIEAFKAEFPVEAGWLISHSDGNTFADSLRQAVEKYGRLTDKQLAAVRKGIAREDDSKVAFDEWCEAYPGVLKWLSEETAAGNEFAGSLLTAGCRFGSLTDGQLNAVQRNIDENRTSDAPESELDLSALPAGRYAVPNGETRLKLLVRKPGKRSKWFGWTFVSDDAAYGSRRTYGKQGPEGRYKGQVVSELQAIMADPFEASKAYGRLVGACGVCGRRLEDEQSIEAGIGPVCAAKF